MDTGCNQGNLPEMMEDRNGEKERERERERERESQGIAWSHDDDDGDTIYYLCHILLGQDMTQGQFLSGV